MRYLAIWLLGSLSACASHPAPPVASAASVEAATNVRSNGPSFAPVGVDRQAAAPVDAKTTRTPAPRAMASTSESSSSAPVLDRTWGGSTGQAPSNAAAMPAPSPSPYEAVNARDRNGTPLTSMDQGKSEADRKITQQIRRAVGDDTSLSFRAKNVKIITLNSKVTLRGAVKSDAERIAVAALARKIAGESQVENYLEVSE